MAVNGYYDFYITSDDHDWEMRILQKLQAKGFRGYHRQKFTLGGLKSTSRLRGVKNSKVKIIGFVPPSKKKTDTDNYVATLALEFRNERDRVICVKIAKDSIIPDEYSGLNAYNGWDEDALCNDISDSIKSVCSGGEGTSSATETGDVMDARTSIQPYARIEQDFGPLTDLRLAELSTELGHDWSMLATYLGISIAEQQDLRQDFQYSRERNEQMLVKWRARGSSSPTEKLEALIEACQRCKRIDLKEEVSQWQ